MAADNHTTIVGNLVDGALYRYAASRLYRRCL